MTPGPFKFGIGSKSQLKTLHPDLQAVCNGAIKLIDFVIVEGHRTPARQLQLYAQGRTAPGPVVTHVKKSEHTVYPSRAMDVAPYSATLRGPDWSSRERFIFLGGIILGVAGSLGIDLRWGGDFDEDNDLYEHVRDRDFVDLPHFEIEL